MLQFQSLLLCFINQIKHNCCIHGPLTTDSLQPNPETVRNSRWNHFPASVTPRTNYWPTHHANHCDIYQHVAPTQRRSNRQEDKQIWRTGIFTFVMKHGQQRWGSSLHHINTSGTWRKQVGTHTWRPATGGERGGVQVRENRWHQWGQSGRRGGWHREKEITRQERWHSKKIYNRFAQLREKSCACVHQNNELLLLPLTRCLHLEEHSAKLQPGRWNLVVTAVPSQENRFWSGSRAAVSRLFARRLISLCQLHPYQTWY